MMEEYEEDGPVAEEEGEVGPIPVQKLEVRGGPSRRRCMWFERLCERDEDERRRRCFVTGRMRAGRKEADDD